MKIKISSKLFKKILKPLYRISYAPTTEVEFNSFYFETKEDCLVIFAKNKLLETEKVVPVSSELKILQPGKMVVNAFVLNEIVQKTNDQEIALDVLEEKVVVLQTKKHKTKINLLDLNKFWSVPRFNVAGVGVVFSVEILQKILNQVAYATCTKEGRTIFQGINLRTKNQQLIATATDGSRIARSVLFPFDEELDLVLYLPTITEVFRIVEFEEVEKIHVTFGDKGVFFQIGKGTKLFSRIIGGAKEFPNTENQFTNIFETTVECKKQELFAAIEKAGIIFEKNAIPSVVFLIENNQFLVLSSGGGEIGFFEEKIETTRIDGKDQNLSLQAKFVLSALKSLPEDNVVVCFSANEGPVFLTNKNNEQLKVLILPIWT